MTALLIIMLVIISIPIWSLFVAVIIFTARACRENFELKNIAERMKVQHEVFLRKDSEEINKAYELGRIEALNSLRMDLYYFVEIVGTVVTILGFAFGFVFIPKYVDSIADDRVEREIDKRIDRFSKFRSYIEEVFPIMEYDFYRIRSIVIDLILEDFNDRKVFPAPKGIDTTNTVFGIDEREIEFIPEKNIKNFSIKAYYKYPSLIKDLKGKTIDEMPNIEKLKISLTTTFANGDGLKEEYRLSTYLKQFNFMININNVIFETHNIQVSDFQIEEKCIVYNNVVEICNEIEIFLDIVNIQDDNTKTKIKEKYRERLKENMIDQK